MKPEYWRPCILGLVWLCDHANEFNATKNTRGKEKQNDEWWWGANQRIEKSVHRSIKLSWGEKKNSREISTQAAVENGMQETMSADLNATVLLVTHQWQLSFVSKKDLKCFCIINEVKDSKKEFCNWFARNNMYCQHAYFYLKRYLMNRVYANLCYVMEGVKGKWNLIEKTKTKKQLAHSCLLLTLFSCCCNCSLMDSGQLSSWVFCSE